MPVKEYYTEELKKPIVDKIKAEKNQNRYVDNLQYTLFTMATIWALNITHAVILDLDRNVDNMPEVDIVLNESTNQPQLRLSIALD